jgi:acetyltransferase-like isoleucine patch superfamily enzyme
MRSIKNQVLELFRKAKIVIDIVTLPEFATKSKHLRIESPRKISNPENIRFGNGVYIGPSSVIAANTGGNFGSSGFVSYNPSITIGDRVFATSNLEIYCCKEITIENDVMLAANVFIYDHSHGYETANVPYKDQPMTKIESVRICKGVWIGKNSVILSGITVGEYSIIGANSVVTTNIPARCIAVGSPAKPIKKWDEQQQAWVKYQ